MTTLIDDDDLDNENENESGGSTMLSLLDSYYGIQQGSSAATEQEENKLSQAEQMDTAYFDPNKYFRVLNTLYDNFLS